MEPLDLMLAAVRNAAADAWAVPAPLLAYRAQNGSSVDDHRDRLARMYSRFSEIAAENPSAWNRKRIDPETIRNASERNPMQAFPYAKLHCSTWNVDQAGALLFCLAKRADELGITHEKRIYPVASTRHQGIRLRGRAEGGRLAHVRCDGCNDCAANTASGAGGDAGRGGRVVPADERADGHDRCCRDGSGRRS